MTGPRSTDRFNEAKRLASLGFCQKDASAMLGMRPTDLCQFAKRHGLTFRHGLKRDGQDDRSQAMVALYRSGKTLQEIGDLYHLTRERVRQIVTKSAGRVSADGGIAVKTAERKSRIDAKRDSECLGRWGCTFKEWQTLRSLGRDMVGAGSGAYQTPLRAYHCQRQNAACRGIGWELSLWQWWQIWQSSGRWAERGRGRGYVMCRRGDVGPYAIGNVYIATAVHNCSERASKTSGLPCGVHKRKMGFAATRVIEGKVTYLGTYPTPELAHSAYLAQRKLVAFIRPRFGRSEFLRPETVAA